MSKTMLSLSISSLAFLGFGTLKAPNDAVFWLASGALIYQVVRIVLISFLLAHFLTDPPRHPWFRLISEIVAVSVGIWTLQATNSFTMPAMDTLAFLGSSIILFVTALEQSFTLHGLQGKHS